MIPIIIFLCILFVNVNCVSINKTEAVCVNNLGIYIGDNVFNDPSSYCLQDGNCNDQGNIIKLILKSSNSEILYWSNLTCFSFLSQISISSLNLETDFIYNPLTTINSLYFFNISNISIYKELPPYTSLQFTQPFFAEVDSSFFKNVDTILYISSIGAGSLNFLNSKTNFIGKSTTISINTYIYPNLTNFPYVKELYIAESTEKSLIQSENIKSYTNINHISFQILKGGIPIEVTQIVNPQYTSVSFSIFAQQELLYDFSNKREKDIEKMVFDFSFNYTGVFPISKLPLVNINYFELTRSNIIGDIDFNFFKNITQLRLASNNIVSKLPSLYGSKVNFIYLNQNKFYGDMDDSWCNVIFSLVSNNLNGSLPDCVKCGLGDINLWVKLQLNPNLDLTPSCSLEKIIPNIYYNSSDDYVYLYGQNLGFFNSNIITIPRVNFETVNYNKLFKGKFENAMDRLSFDKINIYFAYPGYNYTLSLLSSVPPVVNSVIQNKNIITFEGSNFSYNSSDIEIIIGDNVKCNVFNATFYQLECQFVQVNKSQVTNLHVTIKSNGLSTTVTSLINKVVYDCPVSDCNNNGVCDTDNGICQCNIRYLTINNSICTIPNHYLSSNGQVDSKTGGLIQLFGWFGNINDKLNVIIGNNACAIISVNESLIECNIASGTGLKSIHITQNGIDWTGSIYPYYDSVYICPNDCNAPSNGKCDSSTGNCVCNKGYYGLDCKSSDSSNTNTTIDNGGSVIISDEYLEFLLSIDSIIEYDIYKHPILIGNLTNNWKKTNNSNTPNISIFTQSINNASIILTVEEVLKTKLFSFAGNSFTVESGGIKISISIQNWLYSSSLNHLQLLLSSTLEDTNTDNNDDCIQKTSIESSSNSKTLQDNINYLKISKYGKSLYGRFQNRMISNSNPTVITTKIISQNDSKVFLSIDLPHCDVCELDPDFSVLTDPSSKNEECKKKNWYLPVIITIPIFVVVSLSILFILYYFKLKNEKKLKIKLTNIKNRISTNQTI